MKATFLRVAIVGAVVGQMSLMAWAQAPAPTPPRPAAAPAARPVPSAQAPAANSAPKQVTSSVTATLYRIDEGMFDLRHGQSIDLTDRKVLLTFTVSQNASLLESKHIYLAINGTSQEMTPGRRLNLKTTNPFTKIFADKAECYLDLIDVAMPKGAPMVATFRFECS